MAAQVNLRETVKIQYPNDVSFSCSKCGLCCGDTASRKRRVLMLKSDAERISQATGFPIDSFAHLTKKQPYVYEMHKTPDGKCMFLKDSQCTIYEYRPLICSFYPFELSTNEEGTFVFTATKECPGVCRKDLKVKPLGEPYYRALLDLAHADLGCM